MAYSGAVVLGAGVEAVAGIAGGFTITEAAWTGLGNAIAEQGTVWENIIPTAQNIPCSNIPATFQMNVNGTILWANANATEHMGEYIGRFGSSFSTGIRSQEMLTSFHAAVNEAMSQWASSQVGVHEGVQGGWELGINTQTNVIYHALMLY